MSRVLRHACGPSLCQAGYPEAGTMKRILTAVVLIALVFAIVFFGQLWMITLVRRSGRRACRLYEYLQLADLSGARIPFWWMAARDCDGLRRHLRVAHRGAAARLQRARLRSLCGKRVSRPAEACSAGYVSAGLFGLVYIAYHDVFAAADLESRRRQTIAHLPDGLRLGGRYCSALHRQETSAGTSSLRS